MLWTTVSFFFQKLRSDWTESNLLLMIIRSFYCSLAPSGPGDFPPPGPGDYPPLGPGDYYPPGPGDYYPPGPGSYFGGGGYFGPGFGPGHYYGKFCL